MPSIKLENLSYSFIEDKKHENKVLDNINVVFDNGTVNVILGPSGSGKTTLLRSIAGLNDKYSGHIYFNNECIDSISTDKRNLSYVTQNYSMYPHMTIFDSIAYPLKLIGANSEEIKSRVYKLAKSLEILPILTRKPKQVSLGQLQRAAIARALIKNPSVCLLDEPLSNLDSQTIDHIRPLIKNALKNTGCTVIYVTHDINEATSIGDNILILDKGHFIYQGSVKSAINSNSKILKPYFEEQDERLTNN